MNLKTVIPAAVFGGLIAYIFGMMSWMVLPFHEMAMDDIPDQEKLLTALHENLPTSGVYVFPMPDMESADPMADMQQKHLAGPIGMIFFHKEGAPAMPPSMMIGGLVIDILTGLIIAILMSIWCASGSPTFWQRVLFSTAIGLAGGIQSWGSMWNWMLVEWDHCLVMGLDITLMWFFGGLIMALIIKPKKKSVAEKK